MGRLDLWESRLSKLFQKVQNEPFEWGKWDCCLFACDAIRELTGKDPAENFRGRYDSDLSAARILRDLGGVRAIAEAGAQKFGFAEIDQMFAQRGDIALAEIEECETLGVCTGRAFGFLRKPSGVELLPLDSSLIVKVWRVG